MPGRFWLCPSDESRVGLPENASERSNLRMADHWVEYLTCAQAQLLRCIRESIADRSAAPTLKELGARLGMCSTRPCTAISDASRPLGASPASSHGPAESGSHDQRALERFHLTVAADGRPAARGWWESDTTARGKFLSRVGRWAAPGVHQPRRPAGQRGRDELGG